MESGPSKRFAFCFFLAFAILWGGVVTLHVLGNPDGMFPSPLVPSHSDRAWKSRRVKAMKAEGKPPQIVVLGSSRMMQVSPAVIGAITQKRAFNFAAVGAAPVEYGAQLRFLLRIGAKPETIIVGIDERAMFGLYKQWDGLVVQDWNTMREMPWSKQLPREWQAVTQIDLWHTPEAVRQLFAEQKLVPKSAKKVGNFILEDGYRVRAAETIKRDGHPWKPGARRAALEKYSTDMANRKADEFVNLKVQPEQARYVESLLKTATANGIKVKLILTPMQPSYAKAILDAQAQKEMNQYAAQLRSRCKKLGVEFFDFRDLKGFNGLDYEFWDEQHQSPINTARMVNKIFGLKPQTKHEGVPDDLEFIQHPPKITTLTVW